jgi:diphthamide biosynthesis methyltransferase
MEMEKERKEKILSGKTLVCVIGSVGSKAPKLKAGHLKDLSKNDFGEGLHSLIIPGMELAGAPKEILKNV